MYKLLIFAFCACLGFSGCGYHNLALQKDSRMVYVEAIENLLDISAEYSSESEMNRYYPNIEVFIRRALMDRLHKRTKYRIETKDNADLIVKGQLVSFVKDAISYDSAGDIKEYKITIGVKVEITDSKGLVYKKPKTIYGQGNYIVAQGPSGEKEAIDQSVEDVAQKLVDYIFIDW